MKILHYSDLPVSGFDDFYEKCDVLVTTGDLSLFDFGKLRFLKERKLAFGVYGNHCSGKYFEELGIVNLHQKVVEHNGFKWGGFQGCLKYKESGMMYSEEEAKEFADTFPYVDILLFHAGPKGMLDDLSDFAHAGSERIRKYVLKKKPKFVFLGHQYSNGEMEISGIKLYRTYGARIIDMPAI